MPPSGASTTAAPSLAASPVPCAAISRAMMALARRCSAPSIVVSTITSAPTARGIGASSSMT